MANANKKHRQKLKRQAKKQQARRRDSISPVKRLADAKVPCECWMSDDFEVSGQAQIFVYKSGGGLTGVAAFMVDCGVVGLKDAYTRLHVERGDLDEMLRASSDRDIKMRRCNLEQARMLVAGGVRWAHENGMRLPKDWVKTASIFGGVGDWASADVSKFKREFAGHPEDLRQRLIGQPFDEYVKRTDISFAFSDAASYLDQESGQYVYDDENDIWDEGDDNVEDGNGVLLGISFR